VLEASWFAGVFVGGRWTNRRPFSAEAFFDLADLLQTLEAPHFALALRERGGSLRTGPWQWFQAHASNVEIFFEAIRLEQVGELEGADIAAALTDFALEVSDDAAQVLWGEARPEPFKPLPFPVKAQAQALTG
jgi:hypothetical protein